ncbi:glucan biosynthesis protein [Halomonas binhaiensis]|uniref:Glucan biosynthesis protein n=1 Tax=Halomonas binhaiensis TaxID=2562282 RepID=A0A5C1NII3_9GAMM|nr:glucan biosynthesis protein [Halomonas binhaiensis]QEM82453.1 glucan biosynthesis protein [Halomonas binhaiensis]
MQRWTRTQLRLFAALLLWGLSASVLAITPEALFEQVSGQARDLAESPYEEPKFSGELPQQLAELSYDQYRQIRYRKDRAIWRNQGLFQVELFHPGFLYKKPVAIHLVEGEEIKELPFDSSRFSYDDQVASLADQDLGKLGYTGFRLHYPLNQADTADEFAVFLGASYFRLVGRGNSYGMSARGLAINTGLPQGEEFPSFKEFWLVRPQPDADHMTIIALLDSPSLSGAYRFDITPGQSTEIVTEARLFARKDVQKLGIAPLTSMFLHGEMGRHQQDDYRPRVHDSSGLLMATSTGEWTWRVLDNPETLQITSLQDTSPKGFGLVQRPRAFDAYLDMEGRYEKRPSQWVEMQGDWGEGRVELVEIPSDSEANDNITAYWVPKTPLLAGESRTYRYRTYTFASAPENDSLAKVVRSRQGLAGNGHHDTPPDSNIRQFIVDFRGKDLDGLDPSQPVKAALTTSSGKISHAVVTALPDGKTWRASFRLEPESGSPADMRLTLNLRGRPLSETWNAIWNDNEL